MEANDNIVYLKPLVGYFSKLQDEFSELIPVFRPTLHTLLLIWKNSKFYNTPARFVVIMRELCNTIIFQVYVIQCHIIIHTMPSCASSAIPLSSRSSLSLSRSLSPSLPLSLSVCVVCVHMIYSFKSCVCVCVCVCVHMIYSMRAISRRRTALSSKRRKSSRECVFSYYRMRSLAVYIRRATS